MLLQYKELNYRIYVPITNDKSTTNYGTLDFKCNTKSLTRKYLVIERHMLHIQDIPLQHLKLNWPICPSQIFI